MGACGTGLAGRAGMSFHHVARAVKGTLLFCTWEEGLALWRIFVRAFPEVVAFCVMPDHVHLILPHADEERFARAMAAYARWRNARRRTSGPVWQRHPPPEELADEQHLRRTIRYVHLNPCRKALAPDPLAWALSTHRDRVGFAASPVVAEDRDPARYQRYVSADDHVDPHGTPLPVTRHEDVRWEDVRDAVTSLCRVPPTAVLQRGPARALALKTAWAHGLRDVGSLTAWTGASRSAVFRICGKVPARGARYADPLLDACVRAVGDPRFQPLDAGDLRSRSRWARYRRMG
ncbi:MAG: transposase [Myxococcota bacterium]